MADPTTESRDDGTSPEPADAFEAELMSFEPRGVSRGLSHRIGADLSGRPPRRRLVVGLAGLATAASLVLAATVWRGGGGKGDGGVVRIDPLPAPVHPSAAADPPAPPTVIEYQRAFARSPEAFDALLARPAGRGRHAEHEPADVATAFSRSASILNPTTTGDAL